MNLMNVRAALFALAILIFVGIPILPDKQLMVVSSANPLPPPGPVVIDFDNLPGGGTTAEGLTIFDQYISLGVVFPFNPVIRADPSIARSGSRVLITDRIKTEFNGAPLVMQFTAPQRRVKVWVGQTQIQHFAQKAILRVFDAESGGAKIGEDIKDLAGSPVGATARATIALEVPLTGASIRRAEVLYVRASDGLSASTFEAIDDLEFEGAAPPPPPPCGTTQAPSVLLSKPAGVFTEHLNEFILEGSIGTDVRLEEAILTVTGPGGSRSLDLLANRIVPLNGGLFGPVRVNGLMSPGSNTVTVKARNCAGSAQDSRLRTYEPIDASTHIKLMGIEITQAIQDINNTVPLIAGKRTFVRVYLRTEGPTTEIDNVSAALTGCRPGASASPLCGDSFPNLQSLNVITINSSTDITAKRRDINASLNFELPMDWISAGRLHLQLSHLDIRGNELSLACDRCDNPNDFGLPRFYELQDAPAINLRLVSFPYTTEAGGVVTTHTPRAVDLDSIASWIRRAYPTSTVNVTQVTGTTLTGPPDTGMPGVGFTNGDTNLALVDMYRMEVAAGTVDPLTRYYGVVSDTGGFMRGATVNIPGNYASGPVGVPGNIHSPGCSAWDRDNYYGDWYGGHEIGHMFGRSHPGFSNGGCGTQCRCDPTYPYPNGYISGSDARFFGFDVGDASLPFGSTGIPQTVFDPSDIATGRWSDVMTYNNNEWISDYTYKGILEQARDESRRAMPVMVSSPGSDSLLVTGKLNLTSGEVQLRPFLRLSGLGLSQQPANSPFSIDLLDGTGNVLSRNPFQPGRDSDVSPEEDQIAFMDQVIPYVQGTRRILITRNGVELASREVSANAPQVTLSSPNGGESLQGDTVTVTWNAADADGDELGYSLLYSFNNGNTWQVVATSLKERFASVDLRELAGSNNGRFRVIATDGVNTSMDDSDATFIVPRKAPQARIIAPANASAFTTPQTVVFVGEAFDVEEERLDGESLKWVSNRQGLLGSGRSIAAIGLMPGIHMITLTARDQSGEEGRASIQVTIEPDIPAVVIGSPIPLTITCPANIHLTAATGQNSAIVNYPAPSSNSQGAVLNCSPPSGSSFPVGITTVACAAQDAFGRTASCSFMVSVYDLQLQDDSSGDALRINSTTGDYHFIRCGANGLSLTGRGAVSKRGCLIALQQTAPDRRMQAQVDTCIKKGNASLQLLSAGVTFTIADRNTTNNSSSCP
jgi:hypothetical protein